MPSSFEDLAEALEEVQDVEMYHSFGSDDNPSPTCVGGKIEAYAKIELKHAPAVVLIWLALMFGDAKVHAVNVMRRLINTAILAVGKASQGKPIIVGKEGLEANDEYKIGKPSLLDFDSDPDVIAMRAHMKSTLNYGTEEDLVAIFDQKEATDKVLETAEINRFMNETSTDKTVKLNRLSATVKSMMKSDAPLDIWTFATASIVIWMACLRLKVKDVPTVKKWISNNVPRILPHLSPAAVTVDITMGDSMIKILGTIVTTDPLMVRETLRTYVYMSMLEGHSEAIDTVIWGLFPMSLGYKGMPFVVWGMRAAKSLGLKFSQLLKMTSFSLTAGEYRQCLPVLKEVLVPSKVHNATPYLFIYSRKSIDIASGKNNKNSLYLFRRILGDPNNVKDGSPFSFYVEKPTKEIMTRLDEVADALNAKYGSHDEMSNDMRELMGLRSTSKPATMFSRIGMGSPTPSEKKFLTGDGGRNQKAAKDDNESGEDPDDS